MALNGLLMLLKDVPLDQRIALSCQLFSLISAVVFYHFLHIRNTSSQLRHAVAAIIGVLITPLCYGSQSLHLFALCVVTYICMMIVKAPYRGWVVFAMCITQVLAVHLYNYVFHYMEFRVDVTNTLMVTAMKVSFTAFSLDDGLKPDSQLTANQKRNKLNKMPSFFEYFCFNFCFLGLLFGPAYHYTDYIRFINGNQYKTKWPLGLAVRCLVMAACCLGAHFILSDNYNAFYNLSDEVMAMGFFHRHIILWLTMFVTRFKYYFGWLSSESICYMCGLGYDETQDDNNKWGAGTPTVNIFGIELATSLKMFADSWNIFTARWLQFCLYERVRSYKVLKVFIMSAVWHGFYPGFYLMFMPLALAILLGRRLRKTLRPVFQGSRESQIFYDVLTWMATTTLIAFNSCAFELKAWKPIYKLERSFYFWPHLIVVLGLLMVPSGGPKKHKSKAEHSNGNHYNAEWYSVERVKG